MLLSLEKTRNRSRAPLLRGGMVHVTGKFPYMVISQLKMRIHCFHVNTMRGTWMEVIYGLDICLLDACMYQKWWIPCLVVRCEVRSHISDDKMWFAGWNWGKWVLFLVVGGVYFHSNKENLAQLSWFIRNFDINTDQQLGLVYFREMAGSWFDNYSRLAVF